MNDKPGNYEAQAVADLPSKHARKDYEEHLKYREKVAFGRGVVTGIGFILLHVIVFVAGYWTGELFW